METEKVGRWTCAEEEGSGEGACPSSVVGPENFFENIGANLCNVVHYWRLVQQSM